MTLTLYAAETRGEKGRVYPPATMRNLLCGLLSLNLAAARFLDKKNPTSKVLHICCRSHEGGDGRQVKHGEVVTKQEENKQWESGGAWNKSSKGPPECCLLL